MMTRFLDFDFLQTAHNDWASAPITVSQVTSSYSKTPPMPVVNGEVVYEWHKNARPARHSTFHVLDLHAQRRRRAYVRGGRRLADELEDRARQRAYETTPWHVAMHFPGSAQLGLGKKLLEEYPWWRFEPHPEWVEPRSTTLFEPHAEWYDNHQKWAERKGRWDLPYAAGIPGEVRFIYIPGNNCLPVDGAHGAAPGAGVAYRAFLFDPVWGKRFDLGTVVKSGPCRDGLATARRASSSRPTASLCSLPIAFDGAEGSAWKDYGTATPTPGGPPGRRQRHADGA